MKVEVQAKFLNVEHNDFTGKDGTQVQFDKATIIPLSDNQPIVLGVAKGLELDLQCEPYGEYTFTVNVYNQGNYIKAQLVSVEG